MGLFVAISIIANRLISYIDRQRSALAKQRQVNQYLHTRPSGGISEERRGGIFILMSGVCLYSFCFGQEIRLTTAIRTIRISSNIWLGKE